MDYRLPTGDNRYLPGLIRSSIESFFHFNNFLRASKFLISARMLTSMMEQRAVLDSDKPLIVVFHINMIKYMGFDCLVLPTFL